MLIVSLVPARLRVVAERVEVLYVPAVKLPPDVTVKPDPVR